MDKPISLNLEQVDIINQSLIRASSIAQLLADCGTRRKEESEFMDQESVFIVVRILSEELEKISEVLETAGGDSSPGQRSDP